LLLQLSLLNSALVWAVSRLALPAPSAVVDSAGVDEPDGLADGLAEGLGDGVGEALAFGVAARRCALVLREPAPG
jgi:hypothetical protein